MMLFWTFPDSPPPPCVYQHLEVLDAYLEMFVCSGACAWNLARASFRPKQLNWACQAELLVKWFYLNYGVKNSDLSDLDWFMCLYKWFYSTSIYGNNCFRKLGCYEYLPYFVELCCGKLSFNVATVLNACFALAMQHLVTFVFNHELRRRRDQILFLYSERLKLQI